MPWPTMSQFCIYIYHLPICSRYIYIYTVHTYTFIGTSHGWHGSHMAGTYTNTLPHIYINTVPISIYIRVFLRIGIPPNHEISIIHSYNIFIINHKPSITLLGSPKKPPADTPLKCAPLWSPVTLKRSAPRAPSCASQWTLPPTYPAYKARRNQEQGDSTPGTPVFHKRFSLRHIFL